MSQYPDDDRRVHDEMEAEGRDHCEYTKGGDCKCQCSHGLHQCSEPTPEELGCTDDNIKDIRDLKAAVAKHATMIADNKRYVERLISLIDDLGKIIEHQKQCINSHNADIIALQIKTD
jgi:hypothetical protein